MYYPETRAPYRVFDTCSGTIVWSGSDRTAASANFENSVESFKNAGIKTYIILQGLDEKGIYRRMRERMIV